MAQVRRWQVGAGRHVRLPHRLAPIAASWSIQKHDRGTGGGRGALRFTAALLTADHVRGGRVEQSNFHDYGHANE